MSDTPPVPSSAVASLPSVAQRAEQFDLLVASAKDFAMFLLDAEGNVISWNEGAHRIMGYDAEEVLGHSTHRFYTPEDQQQGIPERQLQVAREQGKALNERWQQRKDGSRFYASGIDQALRDAEGDLRGYSLIFRDQTHQRQQAAALQASEERFRHLVESVTEYALFALDAQGHVTEWNIGAERIMGYRAAEIVGQSASVIFTPLDLAAGEDQKELQQAASEGRAEDERWHVRKDGTRFWASGVMMRVQQGDPPHFIKVLRDMTQSRQAQEERAQLVRETTLLAERQRMAQELHDTLAHGFVSIKLQMDAAEENLPEGAEACRLRIVKARDLAQESLTETRRVVGALRSTLLEEQSLTEALQALAEQATNGVKVTLTLQGRAFVLPATMEDDLLRIGQEALTNALRHAHARHITLTLTYLPTDITLEVADDGQGFDTSGVRAGFGVTGMQERTQRLNGALTLTSRVGAGTTLLVQIPLSQT